MTWTFARLQKRFAEIMKAEKRNEARAIERFVAEAAAKPEMTAGALLVAARTIARQERAAHNDAIRERAEEVLKYRDIGQDSDRRGAYREPTPMDTPLVAAARERGRTAGQQGDRLEDAASVIWGFELGIGKCLGDATVADLDAQIAIHDQNIDGNQRQKAALLAIKALATGKRGIILRDRVKASDVARILSDHGIDIAGKRPAA